MKYVPFCNIDWFYFFLIQYEVCGKIRTKAALLLEEKGISASIKLRSLLTCMFMIDILEKIDFVKKLQFYQAFADTF